MNAINHRRWLGTLLWLSACHETEAPRPRPVFTQQADASRSESGKRTHLVLDRCTGGDCSRVCEVGHACELTCSGGDCSDRCEAGSVCTLGCSGGSCTQRCEAGASCRISCSGGACLQSCDPAARCAVTCSGDACQAP